MANSSLQTVQGKEMQDMKGRTPSKGSSKSRKPFFTLVEKCKSVNLYNIDAELV